jgi:hypothetical protein
MSKAPGPSPQQYVGWSKLLWAWTSQHTTCHLRLNLQRGDGNLPDLGGP